MRRSLALLALFVAYLAAAKLGLSLAFVHPSATPIWPPTGIAIAGVLLLGPAALPSIFFAAFIINAITAGTPVTAAVIGVGNMVEAAAGAYFIRALGQRRPDARSRADDLPLRRDDGADRRHLRDDWRDDALRQPATRRGPLHADLADVVDGRPLRRAAGRPARSRVDRAAGRTPSGDVSADRDRAAVRTRLRVRGDHLRRRRSVAQSHASGIPDDPAARLGRAPFRAPLRVARHCDDVDALRPGARFADRARSRTSSENTALLILATFIATLTATMLPMAAVVAERRRAEAERARLLRPEHAARVSAEATSSAKDDFLAMLGHELRNPLSAIATAAMS